MATQRSDDSTVVSVLIVLVHFVDASSAKDLRTAWDQMTKNGRSTLLSVSPSGSGRYGVYGDSHLAKPAQRRPNRDNF